MIHFLVAGRNYLQIFKCCNQDYVVRYGRGGDQQFIGSNRRATLRQRSDRIGEITLRWRIREKEAL